jgi:hypothetical protein
VGLDITRYIYFLLPYIEQGNLYQLGQTNGGV